MEGVPGWARYVYQKAYVEFFCSPASFRALEARLAAAPSVTYMAVNAAGQSVSNVPAGAVRGPRCYGLSGLSRQGCWATAKELGSVMGVTCG